MPDPTHSIEPFQITDISDLHALNRALQVALRADSDDPALVGSPIVAALAHRVVDALIEAERARSGASAEARWASWRRIESRPDLLAWARRTSTAAPRWATWTRPERQRYVEALIAPFVATDATMEVLLTASASEVPAP